uniref:Putative secreted peptide n=2 Tax=Nyssorhynchus TaxID=44543 RepID=A0A2M3ZMY9_9DIPT
MYSCVPTWRVWRSRLIEGILFSLSYCSSLESVTSPKSPILILPSSEKKMLLGFRSLCISPFRWTYSTPETICSKIGTILSRRVGNPFKLSHSLSDCLWHSCIWMYR